MKKFKKKHVPNTMPGYNVAVKNAPRFHSRPFIVLYRRAEKYPAIKPIITYRNTADVISAPLDAGDNIPSIATTVKYANYQNNAKQNVKGKSKYSKYIQIVINAMKKI